MKMTTKPNKAGSSETKLWKRFECFWLSS